MSLCRSVSSCNVDLFPFFSLSSFQFADPGHQTRSQRVLLVAGEAEGIELLSRSVGQCYLARRLGLVLGLQAGLAGGFKFNENINCYYSLIFEFTPINVSSLVSIELLFQYIYYIEIVFCLLFIILLLLFIYYFNYCQYYYFIIFSSI